MKNNRIVRNCLIICSLAFMLSACANNKKKETKNLEDALSNAQNVENEVEQKVKVENVFERDVNQEENYTATVVANIKNNISPKMSSRIERIYVEVGDYVRKGQILARMEEVSLTQAKSKMLNDSIELSRTRQLFDVGGASKSELESRMLAYTISKTNYDNLVENTILRSPISGIVTQRYYDTGDMFTMAQPLYVVEQISPVKLKVNASEQYFNSIKKGMTVDIKCDVYGDRAFKGVVDLVYPTIDATTRTFPVEILIQNSDMAIRPGMFARATFKYGTKKHIVVPDRAIQKQTGSGDRYVYVVEDGRAVYKKVELGRRMDTEYEIISGLENGDTVIVEGFSRISNGSKVSIVE